MNQSSSPKWIAFSLTAFVCPGMGHFFLKKKLKGAIFLGLTLLLFFGGMIRYMSVLFALANKQGVTRPPHLNPLPLMAKAWNLDHKMLLAYILGLVLVWILAIADVLIGNKKKELS